MGFYLLLMSLITIEETVHAALHACGTDIPPPPWREIGNGVWGIVYDLGDGTALKLVRKRGGLGSPAALMQRETAALGLLGGRAVGGFQVPALLGHGELTLPANPLVSPMEGWLRLSFLDGRPLAASIPSNPDERQRLGERLGATIADFHHDATALIGPGTRTFADPVVRAIGQLRTALAQPEYKELCDRLLARWEEKTGGKSAFLHGDLNFSNILIDPRGGFGLVDFAESGFSAPHADFRHFEERPEIRDPLFMGYQAASGAPVDIETYYLAATVNALGTLYFGGSVQPGVAANDPRKGMRLKGMVRHCAGKAGLDL